MNTWTAIVTHSLQHSQAAAGLVDLFLKSFVILLVAGGVCLCWRRGAASARHLVWLLAVAGLLVLPGLSGLLPAWQRPLWAVGARADAENELTLTLELAPAEAGLNSVTPSSITAASPVFVPGKHAGGQRLATHFRTGWAALALAAWLAGAGFILFSIAVARLQLHALRRDAHAPANAGWLALLNGLRKELRIDRRVTLLQSVDDVMPVTWGWWRPVILLPAEADEWSLERRRVVLLHELAHVKRWDCLTQMLARLACAVYWFNPLVWVAARRMGVERESACDDLVLNVGCKASDYAAHLVEIARTFRRVPQVAAIAMARSSPLEGRIAAIVDASRVRRNPRAVLVAVCGLGALVFTAALATQKSAADPVDQNADGKPWYDARLRAFFVEKAAQARQLAGQDQVFPDVWPYFAAGTNGDWQTATNLWTDMRNHAHQYGGTTPEASLDKVWSPILETDLAWEQFHGWTEKYVLAYGNDIINSIPPGSIYLGGTDPGRGVITAMSQSQVEGKPFYTITQNALADGTYLDYLQAMYGSTLYIATRQDTQRAFDEYVKDARQRLAEHKLKPGEDVREQNGHMQVNGQVAVMGINGLIVKTIFDRNPDREFYIEESFPLDWMYPYLTPNGLIMKINRQPLKELSSDIIQQDHAYWANYLKPMLGDWLNADATVADVTAFVEKVYLRHDLDGFTGDPQFAGDLWARKSYSKLRSSMGGVYNWRDQNAQSPQEKKEMTTAANFAFLQALAMCPESPEIIQRYVDFLLSENRQDDAILVAKTGLQFDPQSTKLKALLEQARKSTGTN
jgi:beta-lactamase regulating signal transducer with metallopeptidase domain